MTALIQSIVCGSYFCYHHCYVEKFIFAMKTILVPTDFSPAAYNAIEYALEISTKIKAKLTLFHVYQYPVVPTEAPIMIPIQDLEKDSMDALRKLKKDILSKHNTEINIELHCRCGFAADEINDFAMKNKINFIVMGMSGTGFINEKIIGSTTTSLIRKSKCPVLVIDNEAKYREIRSIALATDLQDLKNEKILKPLKEIAQILQSHIYIIHVNPEEENIEEMKKKHASYILDHFFNDINHSFHSIKDVDIITGIKTFINKKEIDLVVMIPREHSVWKALFQEPNTKKLAFHTQTPLLTLHE